MKVLDFGSISATLRIKETLQQFFMGNLWYHPGCFLITQQQTRLKVFQTLDLNSHVNIIGFAALGEHDWHHRLPGSVSWNPVGRFCSCSPSLGCQMDAQTWRASSNRRRRQTFILPWNRQSPSHCRSVCFPSTSLLSFILVIVCSLSSDVCASDTQFTFICW